MPCSTLSTPAAVADGESEFCQHEGTVRDVLFVEQRAGAGPVLISAGAAECIHVSDSETAAALRRLEGHTGLCASAVRTACEYTCPHTGLRVYPPTHRSTSIPAHILLCEYTRPHTGLCVSPRLRRSVCVVTHTPVCVCSAHTPVCVTLPHTSSGESKSEGPASVACFVYPFRYFTF